MKLRCSEKQYFELLNEYGGVCCACGAVATDGCEPDGEGYPCETCEANAVMGMETALLTDVLVIQEKDNPNV